MQLSLVLNAQQYSVEQIDEFALEIAQLPCRHGGDGDREDPGLILALAEAEPGLAHPVSSVATCRNADLAPASTTELRRARLILPRATSRPTVNTEIAAVPDLGDRGLHSQRRLRHGVGSCNTLHLPGALGGPICLDCYACVHRHRDGRPLAARARRRLPGERRGLPGWLWYRFSGGFTTTAACPLAPGMRDPDAVAAASIALKIAGREGPSASSPACAWSGRSSTPMSAADRPRR